VLERLAASNTLLAFDYDGVLAPLVREPGGARMRPSTRRLLERVVSSWPVAVISGRAFVDTRRLSEGVVPLVVGNHGYELLRARRVPADVVAKVAGWRASIERDLAGVGGWFIEDKRSTLAVHYGLRRRWRGAEDAVRRAAARLDGARLVRGKRVLNVIPVAFPNKGDAVLALLDRLALDVALYLGDDVTDEDAFAVGAPRIVGVRVGPGRSLAPWRIARQEDVDRLLETLLELRLRRPPEQASSARAEEEGRGLKSPGVSGGTSRGEARPRARAGERERARARARETASDEVDPSQRSSRGGAPSRGCDG
jgi:trehalose 6-phosphate phosphatase